MIDGHGWVVPRPDGALAKCGGPGVCRECAQEQAAMRIALGASQRRFDDWLDELDNCIAVGGDLNRDKARTVLLAFAAHVKNLAERRA